MKIGLIEEDFPAHAETRRGPFLNVLCALVALGVLIVTRQMFIDGEQFPSCCDVAGYWEAAMRYRLFGLFDNFSETRLRTYAFPGLLSLILGVSEALQMNARAFLSGFQVVTYLLSCWLVATAASRSRLSGVIFVAIAVNPFAIPYLVTGLADATALVMFQFWLGLMLLHWRKMADERESTYARSRWIVLAALISGLTMEIRPAYVWLPAVTLFAALWSPAVPFRKQWPQRLARLFFCAVIATIPMIPQSLINLRHFDRWTPLPTLDLAGYQVTLGKANLKYATRLYPGTVPALFYPNPLYDSSEDRSAPESPLDWYALQPMTALATIATKFVAAFDFDFTEPYIRDPQPAFQAILRWTSLALMFLGVCGLIANAMGLLSRRDALGPRLFPLSLLIGWGAVTMVTVTELRFSLPMLTLFLVSALALVSDLLDGSKSKIGLSLVAIVAATISLFWLAESTRDLVQF